MLQGWEVMDKLPPRDESRTVALGNTRTGMWGHRGNVKGSELT